MIFHDWKLWPKKAGKPLGEYAEGDIIKLNEGGTPVEFYVAKHDYESGLNGAGRTLVVRKSYYIGREWNSSNVNTWASCTMRSFLNGTYKVLLDSKIQELIGSTTYYYTPGNGNNNISTLSSAIFLLSLTELGVSKNSANIEGSALPITDTIQNVSAPTWTRTPNKSSIDGAWSLYPSVVAMPNYCTSTAGAIPCFTLPATMKFDPNTNLPI